MPQVWQNERDPRFAGATRPVRFARLAACVLTAIASTFAIWVLLATGEHLPRQYTREVDAIGAIRTIHTAQTQYFSEFGRYARSLKELADAGIIDAQLASGRKPGYCYVLTSAEAGAYLIRASPCAFNEAGGRTFYSDQTMLIHEHFGPEPATASDPAN